MGGGSGGGGTTQTSEFKAPLWTADLWPNYAQAASTLAEQPFQRWEGQRIAGINDTQAQGMQYLADLSGNTSPDMAYARRNLEMTAAGGYENPYASLQTQVGVNPFASTAGDATFYNPALGKSAIRPNNDFINQQTLIPGFNRQTGMASLADANGYIGQNVETPESRTYGKGTPVDPSGTVRDAIGNHGTPVDPFSKVSQSLENSAVTPIGSNGYIGQSAQTGVNDWIGAKTNLKNNDYIGFGDSYKQMKGAALDDVVDAYKRGTAAQTDSAYNRVGAFHGGGHDAQIAANESGLARNLARTSAEMDQGQFNRSADLTQQNIGLDASVQQGDLGRNVGAQQNWLGYLTAAQQNDLSRNMAGMQSLLGLQNQSAQQDASRNVNGQMGLEQMRLNSAQHDSDRYQGNQLDFEKMRLGSAQQDIGRDANTDYQFAQMGSQNNQQNLSRNLEGVDRYNAMLVGAQQNDLTRQTNAQNGWASMVANSTGDDLNRDASGYNAKNQMYANYNLGDMSRMGNLYQQGLQQGVDAQQNDYGRAAQYWQAERSNQMNAFPQIMAANQFDQSNARNMIGLGDIQRGYTQDLLNSQMQDWQQQVNYPQQTLDNFGNALSRASGNYGSNSTASQVSPYRANPFASAVGVGLAGAAGANAMGLFGS